MTEWALCKASVQQQPMNMIFCDDDPVFLDRIRCEMERILLKLNRKAEIAVFGNPADVPPELLAACDMAFLDIDFECDQHNGMDLARMLRRVNSRALIFFVTNFIEYAPAGYEVQAFRYILKRDMGEVLERYILQAAEQFAEDQEYLQLKGKDEAASIPLAQIIYLEVMDHSISIHTEGGCYELSAALSKLEEGLAPRGFLRIHKSYLVNMRCIRKYRSRECLLLDGTTLAVSERNYAQQKQTYLLWKGRK